MTRLIRLVRKVVALLMVIVGLLEAGKAPAPAPPSSSPPLPAGGPNTPLTPPAVVPHGPTPRCTYSMAVRADGSHRWIVVCIVYGQSTTLPGDWPTAKTARAALFAFQAAWRAAVANGTALQS